MAQGGLPVLDSFIERFFQKKARVAGPVKDRLKDAAGMRTMEAEG